MLSERYCILIVAIIAFSLGWYSRYYIFSSGNLHQDQHKPILTIGILSARENYAQRDAVRRTWLNHNVANSINQINGANNVKAWFIVGKHACHIPPQYRLSEYECTKWNINISDIRSEQELISSEAKEQKCPPHTVKFFYQGFSFQVNHPILLTKLGIYSKLLTPNESISVALLDLATKEVIVKTSLSLEQPSQLLNGFMYRPVEKYVLPKGYQALVMVEGYLLNSGCATIQWKNGGGVITYNRIYSSPDDFETNKFSDSVNVAPSIGFSIQNINVLEEIVAMENQVTATWKSSILSLSSELHSEAEQWQDMIFVDVVDIYKNIPRKLLHFYNWLAAEHNFTYLLKTDDDCLVDVPKVLQKLMRGNSQFSPSKMWWWSRFRSRWPVNDFGKWAEYEYKSPVYPSFPCGSGYVLSYNLVKWLSQNVQYLHPYQGEDISMGIWLAAVNPLYIEDVHWNCDISCEFESYNRAQLTVKQMKEFWKIYEKCGSFCTCDITS